MLVLHISERRACRALVSLCVGGGQGGALWLEADKVARDAVNALESGDRITVPGPHNQLAALWGQHLPRSVLLPLVKRIWPVE